MIKTKLVTANSVPVEISFPSPVRGHYKIIITNTSTNKHVLIGGSNISLTNYGVRADHDAPPVVIENVPFQDSLYVISEDGTNIVVSVMVIE